MDMTEPDAPWRLPRIAAITVVFTVLVAANYAHALLTLIPAYNALHRAGPWYFVELLDKGLVLTLVTIGLMSVMGAGPAGMWRALRLHRGFLSGLLFALVATLLMSVGFALTHRVDPDLNLTVLAFTGLVSPSSKKFTSVVSAFGSFGIGALGRSGLQWRRKLYSPRLGALSRARRSATWR